MNDPYVSIILPTFNRVTVLNECVESVLKQTYGRWELIIIDDGSDLDIKSSIIKHIECDRRIHYYKNIKNIGLPGARNIGISIACHDYILFIEDDMILKPDAIELLVDDIVRLEARDFGAIAPSIPAVKLEDLEYLKMHIEDEKMFMAAGRIPGSPYQVNRLTGLMSTCFYPDYGGLAEVDGLHACSLYKKDVLFKVKGYDEKRYKGNFLREESDLNFRIKKLGFLLYFEPKSVFYHVNTAGGGCRTKFFKGNYYFIVNHIRYVRKNYGIRSVYMVPFFLSYAIMRTVKLASLYFKSRLTIIL